LCGICSAQHEIGRVWPLSAAVVPHQAATDGEALLRHEQRSQPFLSTKAEPRFAAAACCSGSGEEAAQAEPDQTRPTVSLPAPHLYDSHPWQLVRRLASTTSIGEDPGEAWPKPLISPQIPLHVSDSPLITGPGMSPWVKNADVCLRQVFCTTASMLRLPTSSCKEEEETRHARRYPHPFGRNISKGRPVKARTDPLQAAVRRFVPFATCPADPPDLGKESQKVSMELPYCSALQQLVSHRQVKNCIWAWSSYLGSSL